MKKYIFLSLMVTFTKQCTNVDYFAQGLKEIASAQPIDLTKLFDAVIEKYKEEKYDEVKKLIENAPKELFGKVPRRGTSLVMELIRKYKYPPLTDPFYFDKTTTDEYKKLIANVEKNQLEIIALAIQKSTSDQLMFFYSGITIETALSFAVRTFCLAVIKPLLEKKPQLIDPDLGEEKSNDVIKDALRNYIYIDNIPQGKFNIDILNHQKNIVTTILEYGSINDQKNLQYVIGQLILTLLDANSLGNSQFNIKFFDGLYDIFTKIVDKAPIVLESKMLDLLDNYFNKKNGSDEQKQAGRYVRYALKKFNELNESKSFNFKITNQYNKLIELGLEKGKSYTLKEILEKTGLQDLLQ